jgi:hypothetical protein
MTQGEAEGYEYYLEGIWGVHVEIGVLWGGSLVLAAKAKKAGQVIGIDPMNTAYWPNDPMVPLDKLDIEAIHYNLSKFSVEHMVSLVVARSHPWPLPDTIKPITAFIDGDHSSPGPEQDWDTLSAITTKRIFVHDYDNGVHPDVTRAVDKCVLQSKRWEKEDLVETLLVMRRKE